MLLTKTGHSHLQFAMLLTKTGHSHLQFAIIVVYGYIR